MSFLRAALVSVLALTPALAQSSRPWSVRVAESVMKRSPNAVYEKWDYTAGLMLLGFERLGAVTADSKYAAYVKRSVDSLVKPNGEIATYTAGEYNLDQINEGRVLFGLYDRTKDSRYARATDKLREQLRTHPRTSEGGFWHKKIYPQQMWLDGLYMAEPFYARYAVRHNDTAAISDVARQFLLAARHLRDPATGLFYHGWDATRSLTWADPKTGVSRVFWGRAVGWYLMAALDVLDDLPKSHRDRAEIVRITQELAEAVAAVQDPVRGVWWQVLDQPNRERNYLEASGSSMFAYAFAKGARVGILPASFRARANRAFDGMLANFVRTNADGTVSITNICKVAGLGGEPVRGVNYEYYVSEPIVDDDYKGVGAFLLAAVELGR